MSTVKANTILPGEPSHDITLGAAGDTLSIGADSINVNTVKDKGGNTLFTSDGSGALSNVNAGFSTDMVLLSSQTPSGVESVTFGSQITSAYDVYCFKYTNIHPGTNNLNMRFLTTIDGTNYNVSGCYAGWYLTNPEGGSGQASAEFGFWGGGSNGNTTTMYATMAIHTDSNDAMGSGELWMFGLNSTTKVKPFYGTGTYVGDNAGDQVDSLYYAGYLNTTSAITGIQFYLSSTGTFDDGSIKMYGLK